MTGQKFKEFLRMLDYDIFKYLDITSYSARHLSIVIEKTDKTNWFDINLIKLSGNRSDYGKYQQWLNEIKIERGL